MIRIIEHGCTVEDDCEVKCNMCGCVFQFGKSDTVIRADIISFDEERWVNHHYIRCPDCEHDICLGDDL